MLLTSIVKNLEFDKVKGDMNKDINAITYNSNETITDSIFVAISGFEVDGHHFIKQAIALGATTVIIEKDIDIQEDITVLKVANTRNALANISVSFYENPSDKLNLIGITGTNGKTSTSYFIKSIFEEANKSIGVIGTMGTLIHNELIENKNTTPESLKLQQLFSKIVDSGTDNCIMEVSSHALDLDRVSYSNFNTGIFTNLSPDHLELHKNMDEYFNAKAKLFKLTNKCNIINVDDIFGRKLIDMVKDYRTKTITYGMQNKADIYPSDINYHFDHTTYTVNTPTGKMEMTIHLPGDIYVSNSLAAIACAYCNGISLNIIQRGLNKITGIKGRMETVYKRDDFRVIIDFAHTEDALEKTLMALKPYVKGRIILVFGVYADNSDNGREKRIGMGKVAANHSDFSIITTDNPKHYNPKLIIEEIEQTIKANQGDYKAIIDRKEAIQYAIRMSHDNDFILIAGKGHESTQVIGGVDIPFDETEIVLDALLKTPLI